MRSFNIGRFGNSDDPWFRVGNVDVNTTIFVLGLGVISGLVFVVPQFRSLSNDLLFQPGAVFTGGQVWRVVTWPFANILDFWTLILFFVFFMLGSQLEAAMGKRLFATYLAALVFIPTALGLIFYLLTRQDGFVGGLRMVELGVLVGFAIRLPNARFWPGIPAWVVAAGIVLLNLLGSLDDVFATFFLICVVAVALVGLRSLGFAEEAHWVPKVPLPASVTGTTPTPRAPRASRCLLYTSPSPRDATLSRMPSSA